MLYSVVRILFVYNKSTSVFSKKVSVSFVSKFYFNFDIEFGFLLVYGFHFGFGIGNWLVNSFSD